MLTMAEIESTLQIKYELQLEELGAPALRELLADTIALNRIIPGHLSNADGRTIAEAILIELTARKSSDPAPSVPSESGSAWVQFFTLFRTPFR